MAKGALFLGWGETRAGHRLKALEVFDGAMKFWAEKQKKGDIDSFEPVLLDYHGGDLAGFVLIKGDREKLSRIKSSPEAERLNIRATLVVHNYGVIDAFTGEEVKRRLGESRELSTELD